MNPLYQVWSPPLIYVRTQIQQSTRIPLIQLEICLTSASGHEISIQKVLIPSSCLLGDLNDNTTNVFLLIELGFVSIEPTITHLESVGFIPLCSFVKSCPHLFHVTVHK